MTDSLQRGFLIVFEGIDRPLNATLSSMLVENLQQSQRNVCAIEFPNNDSNLGSAIHRFLETDIALDSITTHLLFCANRAENITRIEELIHSGITVVCNHYVHGGIANSVASGVSQNWCKQIEKNLPRPDVVFFLEARPGKVAKNQIEKKFLKDVNRAYYSAFDLGKCRVISMNAECSAKMIAKGIVRNVENLFTYHCKDTLQIMYPSDDDDTDESEGDSTLR